MSSTWPIMLSLVRPTVASLKDRVCTEPGIRTVMVGSSFRDSKKPSVSA